MHLLIALNDSYKIFCCIELISTENVCLHILERSRAGESEILHYSHCKWDWPGHI